MARRTLRCWCGRPIPASSSCGCCCAEHDDDKPARTSALARAAEKPRPYRQTDGGPSLAEYLRSKGEM